MRGWTQRHGIGAIAWTTLLVIGAAHALAQGTPTETGEAHVDVTIEASDTHITGTGTVTLAIRLDGELACVPGVQPASMTSVVVPGAEHDGLRVHLAPASFPVHWHDRTGTKTTYTINETHTVTLTIVETPEERIVTDPHVLLIPEEDAGCTQDGYTVSQSENQGGPLTVEPEAGPAADDRESPARFNWFPLVLALTLLAAVAVFAFQRDRGR